MFFGIIPREPIMHWAWRHAFSYGNMLSGTIAHKLIGMRRMVDTTLRAATTEQWLRWITVAAVLVFLGYAASLWFFFVDDAAIPFVYAQNLLRGRGFSYNLIEGQVEGYSDFLHVFVAAAMLLVVKAADLPKYWVFFLGKALSLVCGVTLIWAASRILARLCTVRPSGTVCAMAFLALSGPLALWSCSSLETVAFAVLLALLLLGLVSAEHDDRLDWLTATAGAVTVSQSSRSSCSAETRPRSSSASSTANATVSSDEQLQRASGPDRARNAIAHTVPDGRTVQRRARMREATQMRVTPQTSDSALPRKNTQYLGRSAALTTSSMAAATNTCRKSEYPSTCPSMRL